MEARMKKPEQDAQIGSPQEFPQELYAAYAVEGDDRCLQTHPQPECLLAEGVPQLVARYKLVGVVRATMRKSIKISKTKVKS
jgi:hypothetical protein